MATANVALRTCGFILFVIGGLAAGSVLKPPWLRGLSVVSQKCNGDQCEFVVDFEGGEYLGFVPWGLTPTVKNKGDACVENLASYEVREIKTELSRSRMQFVVPLNEKPLYFCLYASHEKPKDGGVWLHQGDQFFLSTYQRKHNQESSAENAPVQIQQEVVPASIWLSQPDVQLRVDNNLYDNSLDPQRPVDANAQRNKDRGWIDLSRDIDVNYVDDLWKAVGEPETADVELVTGNRVVAVPSAKGQMNELQDLNESEKGDDVPENSVVAERFRRKRSASSSQKRATNSGKSFQDDVDDVIPPRTSELYFGALKIEGIRVEESDRDPVTRSDGIPELLTGTSATLRIFGTGITEDTVIAFTNDNTTFGGSCLFPVPGTFKVTPGSLSERSARINIVVPPVSDRGSYYICAKRSSSIEVAVHETMPFVHQGKESWLQLRTYDKLLPLWASIMIIATCLCFSALFSGLNLGLMALDRTELKIIANTGTDRERTHAKAIMPVRDHGNYLLCSLLLGNVLVNSTFTILLDDLTSGLLAVIISTLTIVLLGEITPQAICSRHGLAVGAMTIPVTKVVMALVFPLAYPVSKVLDLLLGEEIGNVYNRERLKELVKVTNDINDLDRDEVNIISGALEMRKKTVEEVMTKIEDVFMLSIDAMLNFETVSEIMKSGYSRIPVFEDNRKNIVTMLYIKDLAFVDPDDNTPLKTLCQYYQNSCNFVFEDTTLDIMFRQFKEGHKGHMAFVHRVNNEGEGDPYYETVGLVTLEDVIEELIQAEIMDETDVFTDNRTKRRRNRPINNKLQDFAMFADKKDNQTIRVSPQLQLATFQFLSTALDAFKPDVVSETILRRLLKQDIIHHIKVKAKEKKVDPNTFIYTQGKGVDYFVLILEGRVEVTVGRENLIFESGPFTYFGVQVLTQNVGLRETESPVAPSALGSLQSINIDTILRHTFVPDYSVRAITDVFYIKIKRNFYLAAKRASLMEKSAGTESRSKQEEAAEQFDDEVEKLLHTLNDECSIGEQKTPWQPASPTPVPMSVSPQTRATFNSPQRQSPQRADSLAGSPPHQPPNGLLPPEDESVALLSGGKKPVIS